MRVILKSRSTWACELKYVFISQIAVRCYVTLHVSVWVEIVFCQLKPWITAVTLHVSVWVEIYIVKGNGKPLNVTLHVSVWVEILRRREAKKNGKSRSTWACELKCAYALRSVLFGCHAPRERVSWNIYSKGERKPFNSHAPRERVSWNWKYHTYSFFAPVTLHVSVWVEIYNASSPLPLAASRSTWACELKFCGIIILCWNRPSRSTWACELKFCEISRLRQVVAVTLNVSVWVEIRVAVRLFRFFKVTLHVSVWVEMVWVLMKCCVYPVTLHVSVWVNFRFNAGLINIE